MINHETYDNVFRFRNCFDGSLVNDDVSVEEVCRLRTLDPGRVVADEGPLVEPRALGTQERSASSSALAHVVNLNLKMN